MPTITKGSEQTPMATSHLTPSTYLRITTSAPFLANDWKQKAECLKLVSENQIDPMLWFPSTDKDYVPPLAKAVCDRCPVRLECLSFAIYTNEQDGIWGGHSSRAVRRMGRKMVKVLRTRKPSI